MSTLKPADVQRVADVARLRLDEAEIERIGTEMDNVLAYAKKLAEVDTEGVPPMTHAVHRVGNVLRKDDVRPSIAKEKVLMNAPQVQDGYFRVPRILEVEG